MQDKVTFAEHDFVMRTNLGMKTGEEVVDSEDPIAQSEILSQEQGTAADLLGNYFRQNPDTAHIADAVNAEARKVFAAINLSDRIRTDFPGSPLQHGLNGKYSELTQHVINIKSSLKHLRALIDAATDLLDAQNKAHFQTLTQISELTKGKPEQAVLDRIQESETFLMNQHRKNSAPYAALKRFLDLPLRFH